MDNINEMAEEKKDEADLLDGGPAAIFMPFVVMENLLDKLKLLNYDQEFVRELRMKPLNRHYFALQTNPGEQFYLFTSLAAWLARKCGKTLEQPQESDDPNSVISNILDVARNLGIAVDFAPSKLKQGYGETALYILDRFADEALKLRKFSWKQPQYPPEENEEDIIVDDDAELTLAKVEEELLNENDYDDEDDDHILGVEDLKNFSRKSWNETGGKRIDEILETTTDSLEWKLELERVLPQLKVTIHNDNKDWRNRLEQMRHYYDEIEKSLFSTRGQLEKLQTDISRGLDKIGSREKYLNSQLEPHLNAHRSARQQLERITEQYHQVNGGVVERSRQLSEITEELDVVKQEMDERSATMTDGTPLINIKKALARLKNEIVTMDVRIAVVEHSLIQAKLRDKSNLQRDMSASLTKSPFSEPVF